MTRSSNGTIPAGLTLYIFTWESGDEIEGFHASDGCARAAAIRGIVRIVNVLSGATVYERKTEEKK